MTHCIIDKILRTIYIWQRRFNAYENCAVMISSPSLSHNKFVNDFQLVGFENIWIDDLSQFVGWQFNFIFLKFMNND